MRHPALWSAVPWRRLYKAGASSRTPKLLPCAGWRRAPFQVLPMFKTARFKIHNPSRHKAAMLMYALTHYHLTLKRVLEAR